MIKRSAFLLVVLFSLISFASAAVVINEVELNPEGEDSGNEWIEVFNDGESVNLSGWYIKDEDGHSYFFPDSMIEKIFVLDSISGIINAGESLDLYDNNNILRDSFEGFEDQENDNRTWGRNPDGNGEFDFGEGTKGFPNEQVMIFNEEVSSLCIIRGDNITLTAEISGLCIEEVIFSINGNNFQAQKSGDIYRLILSTDILENGAAFWVVRANDCFDREFLGSENNFYINRKTILNIIPNNPNGLGGWYITEPLFELINPDASSIFYQWDSEEAIEYNGIFDLDETQNNASLTGGILELNYWSNVCDESHSRKIIKTDFSDPKVENIMPDDGEAVVDKRPLIGAYLDEIYQSNSGINKSKVFMYLDNSLVNAKIENAGGLDAEVSYVPLTDLSEGAHDVRVEATDIAGRSSTFEWSFIINSNFSIVLNVFSPENKIYNDKRVPFNITSSEELEKMEYINYNEITPRWRVLCSDCAEHGFSKKKTRTLSEGENNITIRATSRFGTTHEFNVLFMIESKDPRIIKTEPKKGFTSGHFMIEFEEDNPEEISLFYGNDLSGFRSETLNLSECSFGKKITCNVSVNLMDYEEEEIKYSFSIRDIGNNTAESKERTLFVDNISPSINEFGYEIDDKRIEFYLNVTEPNLYRISYINFNENSPRLRTICTKLIEGICLKKISFPAGEHNLSIEVSDLAGNKEFIREVVFNLI